MSRKLVSLVIPAYNEGANVVPFHKHLTANLPDNYEYEFIFVNDGSQDDTAKRVAELHKNDKRVRLVNLSRNFGKELALTAGLGQAKGDAVLSLDADGQHPVEIIGDFLKKWEHGAQVVIGVREKNHKEGFVKRYGSKLFYKLFNSLTKSTLIPGSTDFRLIDREVRDVFVEMYETNRITRGLIDWLGFEVATISFVANERMGGEASYSTRKLINLAINSFVSLSFAPLFFFGYLGLFISTLSVAAGIFVLVEQFIMNDPLGLDITNAGLLVLLIIFLVGIVLMAQGLIALYISHIYTESKRRPLYVINKSRSILQ